MANSTMFLCSYVPILENGNRIDDMTICLQHVCVYNSTATKVQFFTSCIETIEKKWTEEHNDAQINVFCMYE